MYNTTFWLSLWLYSPLFISAQTYQHKILDYADKQDTVMQLMWPATTPSYFEGMLCFVQAATLRLHDTEINIPIDHLLANTAHANQHYHNIGIYYTPEKATLNNATLHEFGFGLSELIFNPHKDGYYLILTENNGRKSATLYQVTKGSLIRHKSKTCEARITAFPANGKIDNPK